MTSPPPPLPAIDYHWTGEEIRRISDAKKKAAAEKVRLNGERVAAPRRTGR